MKTTAAPSIPSSVLAGTTALLQPYRSWLTPELLSDALAAPPDHLAAPSVPHRLLAVPEAAARLALGKRTVWRLIADGRLPVLRIGSSVRVRETDLAAFMAVKPL